MVDSNPFAGLTDFGRAHVVAHLAESGRHLFDVEDCDTLELDAGQVPEALRNQLCRQADVTASQSLQVITDRPGIRWTVVADDEIYGIQRQYHTLKVYARRYDELHRLLSEETQDGRNAWYEIKGAAGDVAGYVQDLQVARECIKATHALSWPGSTLAARSIGLQYRYALIAATLNSLATNLPAELIVALVENRVWTPEEGLANIRQIPTEGERVSALMALAPSLTSTGQWQKVLEEIDRIDEVKQRASVLAGIAPHLPRSFDIQVFQRAIRLEDNYGFGLEQETALVGLAPHLSDSLLQQALDAIEANRYPSRQVQMLLALAPHLPIGLLWRALNTVQEKMILDQATRQRVLAALLSHLAEKGDSSQAYSKAQELCHDRDLVATVASMVPNLLGPLRDQALQLILSSTQEVRLAGK